MRITPISRSDIALGKITPARGGVFVALGNFDGVHKGHLELLNAARRGARLVGAHHSAVFTFSQGKAPALTTLQQRLALFADAGIDEVFVADFSDFCQQSPEDFVFQTLRGLSVVGVCCGFNFRFGKRAAGDIQTLDTLCKSAQIACNILAPVTWEGEVISSTRIRRCLQAGEMEQANQLLGHPWGLSDEVQRGRNVGTGVLSAPTLNLPIDPNRLLPPFGVYFTEAVIDGITYPSVTNLGVRPTFGDSEVLCETHLLSASGDFYGKRAEVQFLSFHRPECRFDSPEELAEVIAEDIASANEFFTRRRAIACGAMNEC